MKNKCICQKQLLPSRCLWCDENAKHIYVANPQSDMAECTTLYIIFYFSLWGCTAYSHVYFSVGLHLALSVALALFCWSNLFYREICEWRAAPTLSSPIRCLFNKGPNVWLFSHLILMVPVILNSSSIYRYYWVAS